MPDGRGDRDRYSPYALTLDADALGFMTTTATSEIGTCVARHRSSPTSTRATVFLHGAAGAWTTWTPLLERAREEAIDIENPVLLDLPGWGDARLTRPAGEVTIEAIATLVLDLLVQLGYSRFDLVGHSLGGFIAMHMAAEWPESVASVGMVSGTTFSVIASVNHPVREFARLPGFTMLWGVMRVLSWFGAAGPAIVRAAGRTGILRLFFAPLFSHGLQVPRSLIVATAHDLRPAAFVAAAGVARGYDAETRWSGIRCAVRATKGDRDVFVNDDDLERLGRVLPESERTVIPDCGHFGLVERPAAVLAALGFRGPRD